MFSSLSLSAKNIVNICHLHQVLYVHSHTILDVTTPVTLVGNPNTKLIMVQISPVYLAPSSSLQHPVIKTRHPLLSINKTV